MSASDPSDKTTNPTPESRQAILNKAIHDLNGELFLIRGAVELTRNARHDAPTLQAELEKIEERTHRMEQIVKDLRRLDLS